MMDFITSQATQAALQAVAETLASLGIIAVVYLVNRYTGIKINDANVAKLKSAAATEAGAMVASAEDNLRARQVTTSSSKVDQAAVNIAQRNPDAVESTGATHEVLKQFVVGEVGKLQAQQPVVEVKP